MLQQTITGPTAGIYVLLLGKRVLYHYSLPKSVSACFAASFTGSKSTLIRYLNGCTASKAYHCVCEFAVVVMV